LNLKPNVNIKPNAVSGSEFMLFFKENFIKFNDQDT